MKYTANDHIKNIEEVKAFASYLINDLGVNMNPDNDFADYICYATGKPTFAGDEVFVGNKLVKECFDVCKKESVDIYELLLPLIKDFAFK